MKVKVNLLTDTGEDSKLVHRRKRPKVDSSIFDSALSHTRRSDASEKKEENSVSTFGRFRMWTSFESSPVSVNNKIYFKDQWDGRKKVVA